MLSCFVWDVFQYVTFSSKVEGNVTLKLGVARFFSENRGIEGGIQKTTVYIPKGEVYTYIYIYSVYIYIHIYIYEPLYIYN